MEEKVSILDDGYSLLDLGAITMLKYLEGDRKQSYLEMIKKDNPDAWRKFKSDYPDLLKEWGIEI